MSTQLAFRLTDVEIKVLDDVVSAGLAGDRTAALKRALAAEGRRLVAERDAQIYATTEPDGDLEALAEWVSKQALDLE
jgi:hypothetical protein